MANSKVFVDNYLPALLGQAWMLVSSEFHAIVEEKGLSVLEWRVLSTLAGNGSMGITELSQKTVSKQPTITRVLQRLEQQGHVIRHSNHNGSDKRITLVSVTSSGMSLVDGLLVDAQQHEETVLAPLGLRKSKILKQVLQELIERHSIEHTNFMDKSIPDKNNKGAIEKKKKLMNKKMYSKNSKVVD